MKSGCSRRRFLRLSSGTLVSSALLSSLTGWERALAATGPDTSGYKALVCVYLYGGNDGFNWIVPLTDAGYSTYTASRTGLALAQSDLLALNGSGDTPVTATTTTTDLSTTDRYQYGMHSSCAELKALFDAGNLAVLGNVGTLIAPVTPEQARSGSVSLPPQLFSHLDQQIQWQTSIPNSQSRNGWAGRVADLYASSGYSPKLAMNVDVGGANYLQQGASTNMYVLGTGGAPVLTDTTDTSYRSGLRAQAAAQLLSLGAGHSNLLVSEYAAIQQRAAAKVDVVNAALLKGGDLTTQFATTGDDADESGFAAQLHMVARMIKAQVGDSRQIFFVALNGFDTHNSELTTQAHLLGILSRQLNNFWAALGELGMQKNVTVFTNTDFGRTLQSNGDGTDHAWGNHHIILGGAVKGGQYYGTMPSLKVGGPNDLASLGQMVPTTSTDQFAATLAQWFGVPASSLTTVFPNLGNFSQADLGFMG